MDGLGQFVLRLSTGRMPVKHPGQGRGRSRGCSERRSRRPRREPATISSKREHGTSSPHHAEPPPVRGERVFRGDPAGSVE